MRGYFLPFKLINEVPSVEPVGAAEGSHALRPAGGVAGADVTSLLSLSLLPSASPSANCKTIHLTHVKKKHYFLPSSPLPITLALIKTKTELSPIS